MPLDLTKSNDLQLEKLEIIKQLMEQHQKIVTRALDIHGSHAGRVMPDSVREYSSMYLRQITEIVKHL